MGTDSVLVAAVDADTAVAGLGSVAVALTGGGLAVVLVDWDLHRSLDASMRRFASRANS